MSTSLSQVGGPPQTQQPPAAGPDVTMLRQFQSTPGGNSGTEPILTRKLTATRRTQSIKKSNHGLEPGTQTEPMPDVPSIPSTFIPLKQGASTGTGEVRQSTLGRGKGGGEMVHVSGEEPKVPKKDEPMSPREKFLKLLQKENHGSDEAEQEFLTHRTFLDQIKEVLFGVLFYMTHGNKPYWLTEYIIMIVEDLQLFTFFISHEVSTVYWVPEALANVAGANYSNFDIKTVYFGMFMTCVLAIFLMIANAGYVAQGVIKGKQQQIWPIKTLRFFASVLPTVLYIPIIEVLTTVLACNKLVVGSHSADREITSGSMSSFSILSLPSYSTTAYAPAPSPTLTLATTPCTDDFRSVLVLVACLALALYIPVSVLIATVFYDNNPSLGAPSNKCHGKVDVLYLILKTIVVGVYRFTSEEVVVGKVVPAIAMAGIMFAAILFYYPYFNPSINHIRAGMYLSAAVVGIFSLPLSVIHESNHTTQTTLPIFFIMAGILPAAWLSGYYISRSVLRFVQFHTYTALRVYRKSQEAVASTGSLKTTGFAGGEGYMDVFWMWTHVEVLARKVVEDYREGRISREEVVDWMLCVFDKGIQEFSDNTQLHILYALYIHYSLPDETSKVHNLLTRASFMAQAFDEQIQSYFLKRINYFSKQAELLGLDAELDVTTFATFQRMNFTAKKYHYGAIQEYKKLWRLLMAREPNLNAIYTNCLTLFWCVAGAEAVYEGLLNKFPKAVAVAWGAAAFYKDVLCDDAKAELYINRIEHINSERSLRKMARTESFFAGKPNQSSSRQSINQYFSDAMRSPSQVLPPGASHLKEKKAAFFRASASKGSLHSNSNSELPQPNAQTSAAFASPLLDLKPKREMGALLQLSPSGLPVLSASKIFAKSKSHSASRSGESDLSNRMERVWNKVQTGALKLKSDVFGKKLNSAGGRMWEKKAGILRIGTVMGNLISLGILIATYAVPLFKFGKSKQNVEAINKVSMQGLETTFIFQRFRQLESIADGYSPDAYTNVTFEQVQGWLQSDVEIFRSKRGNEPEIEGFCASQTFNVVGKEENLKLFIDNIINTYIQSAENISRISFDEFKATKNDNYAFNYVIRQYFDIDRRFLSCVLDNVLLRENNSVRKYYIIVLALYAIRFFSVILIIATVQIMLTHSISSQKTMLNILKVIPSFELKNLSKHLENCDSQHIFSSVSFQSAMEEIESSGGMMPLTLNRLRFIFSSVTVVAMFLDAGRISLWWRDTLDIQRDLALVSYVGDTRNAGLEALVLATEVWGNATEAAPNVDYVVDVPTLRTRFLDSVTDLKLSIIGALYQNPKEFMVHGTLALGQELDLVALDTNCDPSKSICFNAFSDSTDAIMTDTELFRQRLLMSSMTANQYFTSLALSIDKLYSTGKGSSPTKTLWEQQLSALSRIIQEDHVVGWDKVDTDLNSASITAFAGRERSFGWFFGASMVVTFTSFLVQMLIVGKITLLLQSVDEGILDIMKRLPQKVRDLPQLKLLLRGTTRKKRSLRRFKSQRRASDVMADDDAGPKKGRRGSTASALEGAPPTFTGRRRQGFAVATADEEADDPTPPPAVVDAPPGFTGRRRQGFFVPTMDAAEATDSDAPPPATTRDRRASIVSAEYDTVSTPGSKSGEFPPSQSRSRRMSILSATFDTTIPTALTDGDAASQPRSRRMSIQSSVLEPPVPVPEIPPEIVARALNNRNAKVGNRPVSFVSSHRESVDGGGAFSMRSQRAGGDDDGFGGKETTDEGSHDDDDDDDDEEEEEAEAVIDIFSDENAVSPYRPQRQLEGEHQHEGEP
ncbi:hypothetical protein HDU97_002228 [Phlyctochytrium planicorne]|nr:hypothetical protein HDU97_002228 [Phlyctochytrium planicorne]